MVIFVYHSKILLNLLCEFQTASFPMLYINHQDTNVLDVNCIIQYLTNPIGARVQMRLVCNQYLFCQIGPEKGAIHLATAAIINSLWDLWAKLEGKPVWKLLVDMSPEQLVSLIDFRYM